MHILITGGSGFIGSRLTMALLEQGHQVTNLDRAPSRIAHPNYRAIITELSDQGGQISEIHEVLRQVDAIVHLAGVSIFNRWTDSYKKLIVSSRVDSARFLATHIEDLPVPQRKAKVYISASAIGYYGDRSDMLITESTGAGDDFLANVCVSWEQSRESFALMGMRTVSVRTAIVLGPGGGMMSQILPLFKWGLGGVLGSGEQWFSWIHIDDLIAVYVQAITDSRIEGSINAAAPEPVTNRVFTQAFARTLNRPAWFHIPGWILRIVLGPFASAVLMSQRVIPEKLRSLGFVFTHPTIDDALKHSLDS